MFQDFSNVLEEKARRRLADVQVKSSGLNGFGIKPPKGVQEKAIRM